MPFKPKILVLESDEPTLALVESTLLHMGTDPRGLVSGQEGARLIEQEKFDGVFIDGDNLDLEGKEFVRLVRRSSSNSQIPIAMFTAGSDTRVVAEAFQAGVTLILSKPFGSRELERLLNASRGTMLQERRRYQRVILTVPVICEWGQKRGHKRITGRSLNISNSGMLMRLFPQPEVGAAATMELILPNSHHTLKLEGVVVRTGGSRQVAVQFSRLTPSQRDSLEEYVSSEDSQPVESGWMRS